MITKNVIKTLSDLRELSETLLDPGLFKEINAFPAPHSLSEVGGNHPSTLSICKGHCQGIPWPAEDTALPRASLWLLPGSRTLLRKRRM